MSAINITKLSFAYDGSYDNVFENVSFSFDSDWKLGFIGRNGRGKTTFLNLLLGKYKYSGSISSSVGFEYFPYEVSDKEQNTIDVIEAVNSECEYWQIQRELSLLEVDEDVLYRPFYSLSNGEQTKVLLIALFLKENSFLLIDEPTNHLDLGAREILAKYLKSKKGFVLVSHDRDFLDSCIDHVLSINRANIEIQQGNFSSWWHNKQLQDSFELASNRKLERDIKRLEEAAKRSSRWSDKAEAAKIGFNPRETEKSMGRRPYEGAKAKKIMSRAKDIEGRQKSAIEEKSKLLKNLESADKLKLDQLQYHAETLARARDLQIFYGEKIACSGVSFEIKRGDRLALVGRNGSGKSSIIKRILGEDISYSGELDVGSRLKISYVSQDTSNLSGNLTDFSEENGIDESLFKAILRKLGFSRTQFDKDISDFSAGQKKKTLIAKSLCESAHLHIWDEPLNYIDVLSRIQLEELIIEFEPTLVFVEHDKRFCENIATKSVYL
ncbi:ABC-F type ribosomal protection protein [Clostridiaceae bacterium OttesenSCG-928-D20]|nr:ABC-F type ribosomal protection protein [Clostridiaceae bacterium OttesenSCG-928-D20]